MSAEPIQLAFLELPPTRPIVERDDALVRLGRTVREQREFLHLTRVAAARRADISTRTIKRIELGLCDPGYTTLVAIAVALELAVSDLCRWSEE